MGNVKLFGYSVSNNGLKGDIQFGWRVINSSERSKYVACATSNSLIVASKDIIFQKALKNADLLIPDSFGILLAARILRLPIPEQVTGFDFFVEFTKFFNKKGGGRFFFLGSTETVLKLIVNKLGKNFPQIHVCGTFSPPFKDNFSKRENEAMIKAINQAVPDVLWIGMSAPKQEKWIFENRKFLNVSLIVAIGAVFDFYAETIKRPNKIWQKLGMEWFIRFIKEPKRIWKRALISIPHFFIMMISEKIRIILKK
jgi:N-acetylglucosaminyldiphosphoundecaprenol N-acetyl-beta-D-mannosaminyltransferase